MGGPLMIGFFREREARRSRGENGFTVIELMIAVAIFGIFITVVTSSIVSITKASTKVQVTARSTSGELAVFERLDHQLRYADSINWPGVSPSGDMYIEFRTPASSTAGGVNPLCTQWRYDIATTSLQSRTWNDVTGATPPVTCETDLTNMPNDGGATYPFQLLPAANGLANMQELTLTLDTGNAAVRGAAVSSTFVARNSGLISPSNADVHVPGKSDTPICPAGTRP
jgi:prepilin-type N-terminal cleavage/methylation domain-containing protein